MSQHDDDSNDLVSFLIAVHRGDESAIDLQSIDRKALQAAEGRIPCAEIIDAKTNPKGLQLGEHTADFSASAMAMVSVISRFRQLGSIPVCLKDLSDLRGQVRLGKLLRSYVDARC